MSLNVTSRTVADVASAVRRQFGDESGVQITDPDVFRWVNDGQKDIVLKNKVLKGKATIPAVSNQSDYTLPDTDIAAIESIHYAGVPLRGMPYAEVERYILDYSTNTLHTGAPHIWYEWAGTITFWPTPVGDTGVITVLYSKNPVTVQAMSDKLSIPDKYFNALVQYVLAQAYEMDEDWDATNYKSQQYGVSLDTTADDERTTSSMTYPVIIDVMDY